MHTKRGFLGLLICELFTVANPSIVGVTYRDTFDFEERNRQDLCNPLYWHPLHMPDYCTALYERLIRNKLYNTHPYKYKSTMDKDERNIKNLNRLLKTRRHQQSSSESSDYSSEISKHTKFRSSEETQSNSDQTDDSKNDQSEQIHYIDYVTTNVKEQPYQRMLNEIREDVMTLPAFPIVGLLPPLGLAAIYRQPVSKKTEKTIQKIAGVYAKAAQDSYAETANLFSNLYPSFYPNLPKEGDKNKTEPEKETPESGKHNNNTKTFEINKVADIKLKLKINKMMEPILKKNIDIQHPKLAIEHPNIATNEQDGKTNEIKTKKIVVGDTETYIQQHGYFV